MIYFELSTRNFSVKSSLINNRRLYLTSTGAVLGGFGSGMISKSKAKEEAELLDLKPGTKEYKDYINRRVIKGASIGAAIGGTAGLVGNNLYENKLIKDTTIKVANKGTNKKLLDRVLRKKLGKNAVKRLNNNESRMNRISKRINNLYK